MFVCAGENESFSFAKNIGIGLIDSAISLTALCLQNIPDNIIFVGSAGSYDSDIRINDIFYSFCATNIEISFLMDKSYTPIDNIVRMESFGVSYETFTKKIFTNSLNISQVTVNSSNYITKSSEFNKVMKDAGIMLENMEFFSVLKVAKHFNIPALGIFCVSNIVGENSHNEFSKNHVTVKQRLNEFVINTLKVIL